MFNAPRSSALAAAFLISMIAPGHAQLTIIGSGISGDYSVTDGTTLWSLVQNVTTDTLPGNNGKNAILRDYVVATGSSGMTSVFSLGELNPNFGGTNAAPYIAVNGSGYSLVDPNANASARAISNLTTLQVFAVDALPNGTGGQSTTVNLSGSVTNPGHYSLSDLQNNFTPVQETIGTDVYTGVPLFTFINPIDPNILNQIVITSGTDGYEVVLSLAELDPLFGGNPQNLLPYADTSGDFPVDGIARTILPLDNKHGRWVSNLDSVTVAAAAPEPASWAMLLVGFAGLGFVFSRSRRKLSREIPQIHAISRNAPAAKSKSAQAVLFSAAPAKRLRSSLQMGFASFSTGAVNMITQREVAILTDAIKKQSGPESCYAGPFFCTPR
jgi:hypothetical protein